MTIGGTDERTAMHPSNATVAYNKAFERAKQRFENRPTRRHTSQTRWPIRIRRRGPRVTPPSRAAPIQPIRPEAFVDKAIGQDAQQRHQRADTAAARSDDPRNGPATVPSFPQTRTPEEPQERQNTIGFFDRREVSDEGRARSRRHYNSPRRAPVHCPRSQQVQRQARRRSGPRQGFKTSTIHTQHRHEQNSPIHRRMWATRVVEDEQAVVNRRTSGP